MDLKHSIRFSCQVCDWQRIIPKHNGIKRIAQGLIDFDEHEAAEHPEGAHCSVETEDEET